VIVLDASAVVDLVLGHSAAPWILDHVASAEIRAPAHQPAEALSAIARLERSGQFAGETSRVAIDRVSSLPQRLVPITPAHFRRAFALRERIRVVDGLYVALAEELGCPLVTTDARLARATPPCELLLPPG
jgi:predicted nucleic acid-binding protein